MANVLKTAKKFGGWYMHLFGQRWIYWALMIWLFCQLWSGSVKASFETHYWLSVLLAISVSMFFIGYFLQFCAVVLDRGDATVIQAIKADIRRQWEGRPTLGAFLRGPK